MANTATITCENVTKQESLYNITIKCVVNNGTEDIFTTSITKKYNPVAPNLDSLKTAILKEFQFQYEKWVAV